MKLEKWIDQIDYLVKIKFPGSNTPPPITPLRSIGGSESDRFENYKKRLSDIKAYKDELFKKTQAELKALYDAEYDKEVAAILLKLKAEEQSRFFNQPIANADFEHWSKAAHWSLDEALALSFGKSPDIVTWEKIKSYSQVSAFVKEYAKRRDLAMRALPWKKLYDPMLPTIFISWAKELEIELPAELISNVEKKLGVAINWYGEYVKLKAAFDESKKENISTTDVAEKPLNERERNSLYRIIAALSETLLNENSDEKDRLYLKNQSSLIAHLANRYEGYEGVSKSNLERVLPAAKKLLNPS